MPNPLIEHLDATRILFDLQQGNEIAQGFSGCLEPEEIARRVANGLVEKFDCALARIWLLEPEQTTLKLVASSGMYTHLNGTFGRVPMGAYKVGKIAQNRVSFLSNHLAAETWVGNREWAIANNIQGFAGYPLVIQDKVIGVLATFSHQAMETEFLEVLQTLCTVTAIALDTAIQYQHEKQIWQNSMQLMAQPAVQSLKFNYLSLSDQLVSLLSDTRLTLVGTERPLTLPVAYVFLQAAETLYQFTCHYCRLIYTAESVALEAMIPATHFPDLDPQNGLPSSLNKLFFTVTCLGGVLQTQATSNQRAMQFLLKVPDWRDLGGHQLRIQCRSSVLQLAFTHLAFSAGLPVCREIAKEANKNVPLLTDDATQIQTAKWVLWVQQGSQIAPKGIRGKVDLSTSPETLRQAVEALSQGKSWGIDPDLEKQQTLSERELEILALLTQGHRDRDIADHLIISESTVKFHMNNVLAKLQARTRYQAIYEAIAKGWLVT
ncbi:MULTISPECIES: LuxR C-terminal-related transcriptional regulator [Trichocoleus]|uniref:LuxR C-terminal-related transcriptional regulator n=1 Tax=Trichocoleus desertorum GB2-A4 TaxID=2933944 RepID=A0ABV0JCV6_9CYAN|nr:LuxR C-terminal-related transcriptional regulator [Trichocoleus sp. FACHB-46]MBD1864132.1 GAF domain-containing protein [Trichocoleus sp. FACHB-46]